MLGDRAIDRDRSIDVTHEDQFVVTEVLAQSLVGPAVEKLLPSDFIKEFIRVVHNERHLDMFCDVATFFDLRVSILHHSGLGLKPEGMNEICSIPFHVEVVLLPQNVESW